MVIISVRLFIAHARRKGASVMALLDTPISIQDRVYFLGKYRSIYLLCMLQSLWQPTKHRMESVSRPVLLTLLYQYSDMSHSMSATMLFYVRQHRIELHGALRRVYDVSVRKGY